MFTKKKNWFSNMMSNMLMLVGLVGLITFTSCEKEALTPETGAIDNAGRDNDTNANSGGLFGLTQNAGVDGTAATSEDGTVIDVDVLCIEIAYPIDILYADGSSTSVSSDEELFTTLETWYDANEDTAGDDEFPTLNYPVTVTLEDGTVETVNDDDTMEDLFEDCFEDEDWDDDDDDDDDDEWDDDEWEECYEEDCFTINYPITVILPDGSSNTVDNDDAFETLLDDFYEANEDIEEDPTLVYPVSVTMEDGTSQTINNDDELDALFDACEDDDDDDDDDDDEDEDDEDDDEDDEDDEDDDD